MKKSNLTPANAAARAALVKRQETVTQEELASRSHGDLGGSRARTLRTMLHTYANGRCIACKQVVSLTVPASSPNASTIGVLIPCSMIGDTKERLGYINGNLGTLCRACCDLSNTAREDGTVYVWTADSIDAWSVPLVIGSIPKTKGPAVVTVPDIDPIAYRATSVRINALRGNVFDR